MPEPDMPEPEMPEQETSENSGFEYAVSTETSILNRIAHYDAIYTPMLRLIGHTDSDTTRPVVAHFLAHRTISRQSQCRHHTAGRNQSVPRADTNPNLPSYVGTHIGLGGRSRSRVG
jgi:hypothetical protein